MQKSQKDQLDWGKMILITACITHDSVQVINF